MKKKETVEKTETRFKKTSFLDSKAYNKDLINALLSGDKEYTKTEVDKLIDEFMKGKVK